MIVMSLAVFKRPPDKRVIVHGQPARLNTIVSPLVASTIAWRSDPAPVSFVLVTVNVAAETFVVARIKRNPTIAGIEGIALINFIA
jgi:hypothetical protein